MPDGKEYRDDRERLEFVASNLRGKSLNPRGNVPDGNEHEWDNDTYMELCVNSECFFCGDWTFNYMTRLDPVKRFNPNNLVSECKNCRELRGTRTLAEYKTVAEDIERGGPVPERDRTGRSRAEQQGLGDVDANDGQRRG